MAVNLEVILAVIAAVTGTTAIIGILIVACYSCHHAPQPEHVKTKATQVPKKNEALQRVPPNDTSSVGSAAGSSVAVTLRRNRSDFDRKSQSGYEDFDEVWSYAMVRKIYGQKRKKSFDRPPPALTHVSHNTTHSQTEDEGVLVASDLRNHSTSNDGELLTPQKSTRNNSSDPHGSRPSAFAPKSPIRGLFEV